jgi:AcrR family transcriptional regulator
MARRYQLKRRAQQQDETRQRIVDAAIELHQTIGPMATTMTDIAEQAGVGRVTVYRHFPDELTLARACSGKYREHNPPPDADAWSTIADPAERLRTALGEAYAHHRATERMMTRILADSRDHDVMAPYYAYWAHAADVLVAPWRARGRRRRLLRAGIAHAISFDTWRALVRDQGLSDDEAVEVAMRLGTESSPAR